MTTVGEHQTPQQLVNSLTWLQNKREKHYREPYHSRGFWPTCPTCQNYKEGIEERKKQLAHALARDNDCMQPNL